MRVLPLGLWRDHFASLGVAVLIAGLVAACVESLLLGRSVGGLMLHALLMTIPYAIGFALSMLVLPGWLLNPDRNGLERWFAFCAAGCMIGLATFISGFFVRRAESLVLLEAGIAIALVQPVWSAIYLLGRTPPLPKPEIEEDRRRLGALGRRQR